MNFQRSGTLGVVGLRAIRAARLSPDLVRAMALVAEPTRLARGELAELPVALPYRLRGSELRVYVRHTRDDLRKLRLALQQVRAIPPPVRRIVSGRVRVIDAGCGLGYFALWLLAAEPVVSIVSFEPDPIRAVLLRRCLRANHLEDVWDVVEASPGVAPGMLRLAIDSIGTQPPSGSEPPIAVARTIDLLPELHDTSILRLGAEAEHRQIVEDPRFAAARVRAVLLDAPRERALLAVPSLIEAGYSIVAGPGPCLWGWRHDGPAVRPFSAGRSARLD